MLVLIGLVIGPAVWIRFDKRLSLNYRKDCPVNIIEESQKLHVAKLLADKKKIVIIQATQEVINLVKRNMKKVLNIRFYNLYK